MSKRVLAIAIAATFWGLSAVQIAIGSDTSGKTTVEQRIVGDGTSGFEGLALTAGEGHTVRTLGGAAAGPTRTLLRESMLYFGQLTDFQLADEESPSRVEFVDQTSSPPSPIPFGAAWRPHEAFVPHVVDQAIRQMNAFAAASPIAEGAGSRAKMAFAITTGDSADNQQRNETEWVVRLLEGGALDPNSGVEGGCPGVAAGEAARYTGVQDYDDYTESPHYYDPDQPLGPFAAWPTYPGLMDAAQQPFQVAGLAVPSYVAFGNHDGLAQGNAAALAPYEAAGTGCVKVTAPAPDPTELGDTLTPAYLASMVASDPAQTMLVPADPAGRQYVNKPQYKALHQTGAQADDHGFGFEPARSDPAAGYYTWKPKRRLRFVAIDTVSEGGVAGPSAEGNLDHPQFEWLEGVLSDAKKDKELVVLFGHHPIRTMRAAVPDEAAPPCTGVDDGHGHDPNPGCDLDSRLSTPIHLGDDASRHVNDLVPGPDAPGELADAEPAIGESLKSLLLRHPNAIAYVAGHTHENKITPFQSVTGTSGFWGIETAAEADWPQQNRLLEIMENGDSTLSIFGTVLDHAAGTATPPSGTPAGGLSAEQLASIGRRISLNDSQTGEGTGEGATEDRNVELILPDPR